MAERVRLPHDRTKVSNRYNCFPLFLINHNYYADSKWHQNRTIMQKLDAENRIEHYELKENLSEMRTTRTTKITTIIIIITNLFVILDHSWHSCI